MITHNMKDAINIGNRLIMMNEGKIIYDVSGEEKKNLTTADFLQNLRLPPAEKNLTTTVFFFQQRQTNKFYTKIFYGRAVLAHILGD